MNCIGKFIYKGLEKKEGGEFTNDKGELIKYAESYQLRVDENVDGVGYERKFKFSTNNSTLVDKLSKLKIYEPIDIEFKVDLYNNVAKVIPVDLVNSNNK